MRERTQDYSSANRPAAQQWTGNTRYWTVLYWIHCSVFWMYRAGHDPDVLLSSLFSAFVFDVVLRADRWSSRQHRTSSDMICLTQLFRDACQDAFRSRSHVKPAESLESRPSANLPVLTLNIVQYDEISHRFTTKVLRNLWKMCCWFLSEADDSVRLVPAAGAPTVHPSVNCLINQHLTW